MEPKSSLLCSQENFTGPYPVRPFNVDFIFKNSQKSFRAKSREQG